MEAPQRAITVDQHGNVIGDTTGVPQDILDQLQSPESQAKIKALYEARHGKRYEPEPPRQAKYLAEDGQRRDLSFSGLRPKGMSSGEFRKARRKALHKIEKQKFKAQRKTHEAHNAHSG